MIQHLFIQRLGVADLAIPRRSMKDIAGATAAHHGLTLLDLKSQLRRRAVAHPRQEAMAMMRRAGRNDCEIGRFFNRDRTTVRYGIQAYERRLGGI